MSRHIRKGLFFKAGTHGNYFSEPKISILFFVACIDETDRMVGVLLAVLIREKSYIKSLFSARLVIYGGPLIESGNVHDKEIFRMMLASMIDKTSRTAILLNLELCMICRVIQKFLKKMGFNGFPELIF